MTRPCHPTQYLRPTEGAAVFFYRCIGIAIEVFSHLQGKRPRYKINLFGPKSEYYLKA